MLRVERGRDGQVCFRRDRQDCDSTGVLRAQMPGIGDSCQVPHQQRGSAVRVVRQVPE